MKYSIVIPAYNAERFILKALTSLKSQVFNNIEVIVVNDGSKDNTESVILDFKKSNPTFNLIYKTNENQGPSTARNAGIDLATGDYICFLDADDYYDVHLFEEIDKLVTKDTDAIYFGYNEYDTKGNIVEKYQDHFKYFDDLDGIELVKKKYLKEIWIHNCTGVYSLKLINDHKLRYLKDAYLGEDADFIYRVLMNCKVVKCLHKEYYYHVVHEDSLFNANFSEKHATEFKAIENTLNYIKENNIPEVFDYINSLYYYSRITVAKKILNSVKWTQYFKFNKMVKIYIPKMKKPKVLHFNKKQKFESRLYNFSRLFYFWFAKFYYRTHK